MPVVLEISHAAMAVSPSRRQDGLFRHEVARGRVPGPRRRGCTCCSGSGPRTPFAGRGRCRAARWPPASGWAPRSGRHLAAKVDLTDIAAPGAARDPQRSGARPARARARPPPTWPWCRPTSSPACPADTAWHAGRRPAAHRLRPRLDRRLGPEPAAGQAVLHQHRLRPGPGGVHHRRAARHLRRRARPPGVRDQPAADPDPPRGHRAHDRRGGPPRWAGGPPRSTGSRPRRWWSPTRSPPSARLSAWPRPRRCSRRFRRTRHRELAWPGISWRASAAICAVRRKLLPAPAVPRALGVGVVKQGAVHRDRPRRPARRGSPRRWAWRRSRGGRPGRRR